MGDRLNNNLEQARAQDIPALTGVRFMAALWVVVFHSSSGGFISEWAPIQSGLLHNLAFTGYLGVSVFFVLSGFILAHTYVHQPVERQKRAFFTARFSRVYPAYLAAFICFAPFLHRVLHEPETYLKAGAALLLLQAWHPPIALFWNGPGWSLSAEFLFYLVFPFVLPWIRNAPRLRPLLLAGWLASLLPVLLVLAMRPDEYFSIAANRVAEANWIMILGYIPIFRLPEFFVGMIFGVLFSRGEGVRQAWLSAFALAFIAGVASPYIPSLFFISCLGLLIGAWLCSLAATPNGVQARLLGSAPLVWLGRRSYAIYLFHMPVAGYLKHFISQPSFLNFVIYLGLVIAVGDVVYRFIEEPLRLKLRRAFSR